MSSSKWTEKYGVYKADCGILRLECAYKNNGYGMRVNGQVLDGVYTNIADAQAAVIAYARRLLTEASAALSVLEAGG